MKFGHCSRESEVSAALKSGFWPRGCDPELQDHVASCSTCSDTVLIKNAFRAELVTSRNEARLDSPGIIWWRAQLRRRHDALEQVSKPVTVAHIFALAICIVAAISFAGIQVRNDGGFRPLLEGLQKTLAFHSYNVSAGIQDWNLMLLIPCIAAVALLGGVVMYLVSDQS